MKPWWLFAVLSAVFAGLVPLLVKRGMQLPNGTCVDSNLATAIRVVMLIAPCWLIVWYQGTIAQMTAFSKLNWTFLALSAAATGLSWLFYFKALQLGDASRVAPIDKLSVPFAVLLAVLFLGERPAGWHWVGIALMVAGAYLVALPVARD